MAKDKNIAWAQEYVDRIKGYIKQIEFQAVIDKQGKLLIKNFGQKKRLYLSLDLNLKSF